jgi:hypothetical protein
MTDDRPSTTVRDYQVQVWSQLGRRRLDGSRTAIRYGYDVTGGPDRVCYVSAARWSSPAAALAAGVADAESCARLDDEESTL